MAIMNVNPTRMELSRLKKRLVTATRGHKLLKDKRDELMKQFLELVKENRRLRIEVEKRLLEAYSYLTIARSVMSEAFLREALMFPKQSISVDVQTDNVMSVAVPRFAFEQKGADADLFCYGYANTSGELDDALSMLRDVSQLLLQLAQKEKAAELLSFEIEKTRRRVNALEYVMIPDLTDTIKSITMKLDEVERGNLTRLMKVKDMMIQEQYEARHAQ